MKEKELKDYSYEELINYISGQAIMWLGEGKSIRTIMSLSANYILWWKDEKDKEKEAKKKAKGWQYDN